MLDEVKKTCKCEEESKSCLKTNRYHNDEQNMTKDVPFSTITSGYKNATQNVNIKEWDQHDLQLQGLHEATSSNTRNDSSIYKKKSYNIEGLIEKYCGPKEQKEINLPRKI